MEPQELREAGVVYVAARGLRQYGLSARNCFDAGFHSFELDEAGFPLVEIADAGETRAGETRASTLLEVFCARAVHGVAICVDCVCCLAASLCRESEAPPG